MFNWSTFPGCMRATEPINWASVEGTQQRTNQRATTTLATKGTDLNIAPVRLARRGLTPILGELLRVEGCD